MQFFNLLSRLKLFLILIILIILSCKKVDSDVNPVNKVKCVVLNFDRTDFKTGIVQNETNSYDDNFNLLKKLSKSTNSSQIEDNYSNFYDSNGRLIKIEGKRGNTSWPTQTFSYHKNGTLQSKKIDRISEYDLQEYDELGNVLKSQSVVVNPFKITSSYEAVYSDKNKILSAISFLSGAKTSETTYEYDQTGKLILKKYSDRFRKEDIRYEYNSQGDLAVINNSNGQVITMTYSKSLLKEEKTVTNGKLSYIRKFNYDSNNDLILKEISYNGQTFFKEMENTYLASKKLKNQKVYRFAKGVTNLVTIWYEKDFDINENITLYTEYDFETSQKSYQNRFTFLCK